MNEKQKQRLQENRIKIVNDLEPKGKVLDTLYEDGVLTENDVELVSSAKTRKERCHILLSLLPTRGPVAYGSFQKALEVSQYDFLAKELEDGHIALASDNDDLTNNCQKMCVPCTIFLEKVQKQIKFVNKCIFTILTNYCCLLLDNVEARDLIDQLYQDHVITADDIDKIVSIFTRRDRCEKLFEILVDANKSEVVFSLKLALMKKYSYIAEHISDNFAGESMKRKRPERYIKVGVVTTNKMKPWIPKKTKPLPSGVENSHNNCKMSLDAWEVHEIMSDKHKNVFNDPMFQDSIKDFEQKLGKSRAGGKEESTDAESLAETQYTSAGKFATTGMLYDNGNMESVATEEHLINQCALYKAKAPKPISSIYSKKFKRRLAVAFDYLSTLINQGNFSKFVDTSSRLQVNFPSNHDLMCIIGYLKTSKDLFQTNCDSAKRHIDSTMALVPKKSNPRYFTLELFTAKTRMYVIQKRLGKLQTKLNEAMMILETDPVGCSGRAAGWLYINDARYKIAQLSGLNFKHTNALKIYERLFERAKISFQSSMINFKQDGGKDGPFGFGYALCRLVILLMRCGENGLTMNTKIPPDADVRTAGQYLQHLEDSDIEISKILDMHFRLAKCDYQFRRGNNVRALEHAKIAHDIATELRLFEFKEHAYNRVIFLETKLPKFFKEDKLSEDELQKILFKGSSEDIFSTQSE